MNVNFKDAGGNNITVGDVVTWFDRRQDKLVEGRIWKVTVNSPTRAMLHVYLTTAKWGNRRCLWKMVNGRFATVSKVVVTKNE